MHPSVNDANKTCRRGKKLTDEKMQIQRSEWEKLKVRIYECRDTICDIL